MKLNHCVQKDIIMAIQYRWMLQEDYNELEKLDETTLYFVIPDKSELDDVLCRRFVKVFYNHPDIEVKIGIRKALIQYYGFDPTDEMFKEVNVELIRRYDEKKKKG